MLKYVKNNIATKQQFGKLVKIVEKDPETGRGNPQFGSSKSKTKDLWEIIRDESIQPITSGNVINE